MCSPGGAYRTAKGLQLSLTKRQRLASLSVIYPFLGKVLGIYFNLEGNDS